MSLAKVYGEIGRICLECTQDSEEKIRDCPYRGCAIHVFRPFQVASQPKDKARGE